MSESLEIGVLFAIIILLFYILVAHFIEIHKVEFIHESGVAILLGALASLFLHILSVETIKFQESTFFVFILPPIIFAAGYNLKKKNFVTNFGYIALFGIIGTILSFFVLSCMIVFWNDTIHSAYSPNYLSTKECLLLASIMCATDTVAALTIVKEKSFPTLNSILFGEGVVNDAVSILLFRAVEQLIREDAEDGITSNSLDVTMGDISAMMLNFTVLSLCSIIIGLFFGLITAFVLKNLPHLDYHPVREIFLILLTAYMSYIVSEMVGMSGIITLFCAGCVMSNYAYMNLSEKSKIGSVLAIETFGHGMEAFVFTYLGLSIYGIEESKFSSPFVLALIFTDIVTRAVSVFVPAFLLGLCTKFRIGISIKQLTLIWFSGIIRGAIAFALSLTVSEKFCPQKSLLVSSTLVVVLVTTVIFGGLMSIFANVIGIQAENQPSSEDTEVLMQNGDNENHTSTGSDEKLNSNNDQTRVSSPHTGRRPTYQTVPTFLSRLQARIIQKWTELDEKTLKPMLIKENVLRRIKQDSMDVEEVQEERKQKPVKNNLSKKPGNFTYQSPKSEEMKKKDIEMKSRVFT